MDARWFDERSGMLLLDEVVAGMPSFKKIVADDVVTDEEMAEHAERVVALLKRLEGELAPPVRALVTEVLGELAVLQALQRHRETQRLGRSG